MSAHILVVDDEPAVRDVLVTWLQAAGYLCAEAADAQTALDYIAAHPVDVALLDLALPGRDGLWLAQQIRQRTDDLALIMVTGLQRFDAAVAGIRLGVLDYLLKPFSRQELLHAVRRAVEWRESLRRDRQREQALHREIAERREALAGDLAVLDKATVGAIQALLETLHQRNPDAAAHANRVARMAVDLGVALHVDPSELADIERGALLHDIGKVALPDGLVHKSGPLSEEDFALIRTHVELGRDILSKVPALVPVAALVAASHEAFDGSGYPGGICGGEIPRGARIISIVDTFDALTWGRDLTDPLTFARAAAELVRCAGTRFDPEIVHAWLRVADPARDIDQTETESTDRLSNAGAPW
jgi:response regulator RpfG family c-di-GMP phosphodiesterase